MLNEFKYFINKLRIDVIIINNDYSCNDNLRINVRRVRLRSVLINFGRNNSGNRLLSFALYRFKGLEFDETIDSNSYCNHIIDTVIPNAIRERVNGQN